MYKVIIVDDEPNVRKRLEAILETKKNDFEVLGLFENGYDALETGIPLEPDLIITDIKMPFIDGLELIRRAKIELPLVQTIIVTGFDSFDFAKQAIDLGVIGYISKPVTGDEIGLVLSKAKEKMDKNLLVNKNIHELQAQNESALKAVQDNDLNKLITLKKIPDNFKAKLVTDGIVLEGQHLFFAIFDSDQEADELSFEDSEIVSFYVDQFLKEIFKGYKFYTFENDLNKSVLFLSNVPFIKDDIQRRLSLIAAKIRKACGYSLSVGVSDIIKNDTAISYRKLYRHAKWTLEYRVVVGPNVVLFYSDLVKKASNIGKVDDNEYKQISYSLLYGKSREVKKQIDHLIDTISSIEYKENYFLILNNLIDTIIKSCIAIDELYAIYHSYIDIVNLIYGSKQTEAIKASFNNLIDEVIKINQKVRSGGIEDAYSHIAHFILKNYANPGISLSDVAKELDYSVSYISAILKKKDTSFTKMLTDARMAKAKELLANPGNKMATIADQIGYEDPFYFSHCFKKHFGLSPMEYRKSL